MTIEEINNEISLLEPAEVNTRNVQVLSSLYTIRNNMGQVSNREYMPKLTGTEFADAVSNVPINKMMDLMNEHMEVIKRNGFIYDSSATTKELRNKITIDKGFYEFSPNIYKFLLFFRINLSGGGYLRLMPKWSYSHKLNKCIKNGYYQLYLHPFEIYEGKFPKYKKLNIFEKMYITRGRKQYLSLISHLIDRLKGEGYEFFTMKEYISRENNHE